jgi:predicted small lipoprotein YifL
LTEVPAELFDAGAGILDTMKFAQQWLLLCLAGVALGCGQKGPLVMPDAQKHKRTLPTIPGAPAKPAASAKPAAGGNATATPQGSGAATSPVPPASAPTPTSPTTPPPADSTHL